jgi:hypothetical protein
MNWFSFVLLKNKLEDCRPAIQGDIASPRAAARVKCEGVSVA